MLDAFLPSGPSTSFPTMPDTRGATPVYSAACPGAVSVFECAKRSSRTYVPSRSRRAKPPSDGRAFQRSSAIQAAI